MTFTALPAASVVTSVTATEGDVKTWLTNLHDYLVGLLGVTGNPTDALTALGVPALTGAAIVAALTYTPATATQGAKADAALPASGGTMSGAIAMGNNNITGLKTANFNGVGTLSSTSGTINVDWTVCQHYRQTEPTGSITYTFTNPTGPSTHKIYILSDGTSAAQTFVFPTCKVMGAAFTHVANKAAVLVFDWDGTDWYFMGSTQV